MTQALTHYQVLFDSVRSRARRPQRLKPLDRLYARVKLALASRSTTLARLRAQAEAVCELAPSMRVCSNAVLDSMLADLREIFVRGRDQPQDLRRALATVREAARRETGEEAHVVQVMGALALYHGRIVQMLTGEGKTLTGSLAAPLLAWRHKHLHVFTVNDYLAKRDAQSRACIFARCGLRCGAIQQEQDPESRRSMYALPIVFGTSKQITADYLRDQIVLRGLGPAWSARAASALAGGNGRDGDAAGLAGKGAMPLVPGLRACMVDEADAVLIDEGVVPLIIARSRGADEMAEAYRHAAAIAVKLDPRTDFRMELLRKRATLTTAGAARVAKLADPLDDPIWRATRRAEELVKQALIAAACYINGRQYQLVDGRVVIVDEYTGRFLPDRSWEHGLHQAVEAKEGVEVTADRETLARLSFQRFYRMYPFLCGMTGTAADATGEIESTYQRKVVAVPTNRPVIRAEWPARVFRTSAARWAAVCESVVEIHAAGRPVLVGTRSVEASEGLSKRLTARGLDHQVLNANFDKDEAKIIEGAGESRSIIVATNMAGRGTDIKLDAKARAAGGLHVVLTEMHGARRIDRQFIGRAGRQGDPGSAQIFVSLEDELVGLFLPKPAAALRAMATAEELLGRTRAAALGVFRLAQRLNSGRDRTMRQQVILSDEWVDQHLPGE